MRSASLRRVAVKRLLFAVTTLMLLVTVASAHQAPAELSGVTLVFDHVLPNVPGKSIRGVLVDYAPNGSSPAHTHPQSAFIYATVLEGAIRSQVNGGPIIVYKAGERFSEMPGDRHGVSENARATQRARLLAVFVVDTAETTLTTPITK
jgi:quercetin dioxygenase-like cupin family protein